MNVNMDQPPNSYKKSGFFFIFRLCIIPLYIIIIFGHGAALVQLFTDQEFLTELARGKYTEGPFAPLWYYRSPLYYLLSTLFLFLWGIVGLIICFIRRSYFQHVMFIHGTITVIYFVWSMSLE